MIHTITKIKGITDRQAEEYTELEYIRIIIFENLQSEREIYQINKSK